MAATFQVRPGEPGCAEDALGQLARCHRAVKALVRLNAAGPPSHWRDCHFADATSPSLLKHLLKVEGGCSRMTELSPAAQVVEGPLLHVLATAGYMAVVAGLAAQLHCVPDQVPQHVHTLYA